LSFPTPQPLNLPQKYPFTKSHINIQLFDFGEAFFIEKRYIPYKA
jgi:hypothetical protein